MIRLAWPVTTTLLLAAGCFLGGDDDDTVETGDPMWCGDVDGDGGDTGDTPNVLGYWNGSFATNFFKENCGIGDLDEGSFGWLEGPLTIEGYAPDGLRAIFDDDRENRLHGAISYTGGLAFAGKHPSAWGDMYVGVTGLVYEDTHLDRPVWAGSVYVAIDTDLNGTIDCDVQGDWKALKSGS
jgi:hypothetical protein